MLNLCTCIIATSLEKSYEIQLISLCFAIFKIYETIVPSHLIVLDYINALKTVVYT